MHIFLSYEAKNQHEFSAELARALADRGFVVWQDQHRRRNLRRIIQSWRDPDGELGLDAWLRKGILQSDVVLSLVPYDRIPGPANWDILPVKTPEELLEHLADDIDRLKASYNGEASSKWTDPRHLDRGWYYLVRPTQTRRMLWYEKHGFPPLGKDPFEQWRHWEMRVAGAARLPVVLAVLIEQREDAFAETVTERLAFEPRYVVLRRSSLAIDLEDRLLPAIAQALPNAEEAEEVFQRKRKLRRLQMREEIRVVLWTTLAFGIAAFVVAGFVFLVKHC
ncbi:MAG TPA: hypothetical protein VN956_15900 [Pyrinomonadaceae bacterium]|nr:hypothetical protein [Pyrinomonadaceae bacterium]